MENKYYTPDIEDIRVGYEYERYIAGTNTEYEKKVHSLEDYQFLINCYISNLQEGWIRIPYLTKEQIEGEGWNIDSFKGEVIVYKTNGYDLYMIYKDGYGGLFIPSKSYLEINMNTNPTRYIYQGKCPSINEFRTIMKLLNIK